MPIGGVDVEEANQFQFVERSADPTAITNRGIIYTKDSAGITELFYIDSAGSVVQLTSGGAGSTLWQRSGTELSPFTSGDVVLSSDGTITNPGFAFVGNTASGMYRSGTSLLFSANGANKLTLAASSADFVQVVRASTGAAGTPGYSFVADPNTGMYRNGADQIGFSAGGSPKLLITIGQINVIELGTAGSPSLVIGNDVDTGIFRPATNELGFTTAGAEAIRIDAGQDVGIGATSIDASAKVQIDSTTKGFLPPRMTTTQRDAISSPAEGLMIYNTTTKVLNFHNGTVWGAV